MFINRINGVTNPNFKGYQHVKNETGETVMKFNYPYNYKDGEECEIQFFKASPTENYNYKIDEKPIYTVKMKPEGVNVNLQDVTNLDKDEAFAYRVIRKDKNGNVIWAGADTGVQVKKLNGNEYGFRVHQDWKWDTANKIEKLAKADNESGIYNYTLVARKGTTPTVQGAAYLAIPDTFKPGMKYKGFDDPNTGEIYYDKEHQKNMEGVIRSFSNRFGGGIAGLQDGIPYLKQNGYKYLFTTPIANGDDKSGHGYWNKNNFQVSPDMGNLENYKTKDMVKILSAINANKKALLVLPDMNMKVIFSARNIPGVKTTQVNTLNVYDILNYDSLIIVKDAVSKIEEVYA